MFVWLLNLVHTKSEVERVGDARRRLEMMIAVLNS